MSKVSIQGDQNGTGDFTIKAPNSNTDRTLTLPDEAGSVLTDVSDIEPQVKTATNATGSAPVYACRAWVNCNSSFNILGSANVSSVTDLGVGLPRVNFSNPMPDGNFCAVATSRGSASFPASNRLASEIGKTTSSVDIQITTMSSDSNSDRDFNVAVFR